VEFTLFETEKGLRLLSSDIVVGKEPAKLSRISSSSLPQTSEKQFMESLDEYGRPVFEKLLGFAKANAFPIHWGTKGFSLNVDLDGTRVPVCFGYPPHCVFRQSVYTALVGRGGLVGKVDVSEDVAQELLSSVQETGLFQAAGRELKCVIDYALSEDEMNLLISWCEKTAGIIKERGLRE